MSKMPNKGFFTIAFGMHYQKIAYNLLLSARYNKSKYPFAIITDCSNKYTKAFDYEVIRKPLAKGFINKLYIDEYSPFEESIFIDADCLIFKNIDYLFDLANNKYIAFGHNEYNSNATKLYFDLNKTKTINVKYAPCFNGGIYYYVQNDEFKNVFKLARQLFKEQKDYGYRYPNGDEGYISLAMAKNNKKCCEDIQPIITGNYYQCIKKINILKHLLTIDYKCAQHFQAEEYEYYIYHVSTAQTYGTIYKEIVGELKYRNTPIIIFYKLKIFALLSRTFNLFSKVFRK